MTTVLARDFTCPVCGGPRTTTAASVVVLCTYCGAVVTSNGAPLDLASRHDRAIAELLAPSAAGARLTELAMAMSRPEVLADRTLFRLLCEEQLLLSSIVHGAPRLPSEPRARAEHVHRAVVMTEIATFDPNVRAAMSRFGATCSTFGSRDAVAIARAMLDDARAYYRLIEAHPSLPPGSLREGVEHHARELVRTSIAGYAPLLGAGAIDRVRAEVLGDRSTSVGELSCTKCGGPLPPGSALVRCPRCGAVTDVDAEDAWTKAQLDLWEITRASLVRDDRLDGLTSTISAFGGFLYTPASAVPASKVTRFLERVIPWVTRDELLQGIELLTSAVGTDATKRALLHDVAALAAQSWQGDPSARPSKAPRRGEHRAPTPAEEEAWITATLALWAVRPGGATELLGHALSTVQVAAVHDKPTGCSARAALRFFERASPGFDRAAMHAHVTRMAPAFDLPPVRAFLTELLQGLGGGPAR